MVMKKNGPTDLAKNGCSFGGCEGGKQLCGGGEKNTICKQRMRIPHVVEQMLFDDGIIPLSTLV